MKILRLHPHCRTSLSSLFALSAKNSLTFPALKCRIVLVMVNCRQAYISGSDAYFKGRS